MMLQGCHRIAAERDEVASAPSASDAALRSWVLLGRFAQATEGDLANTSLLRRYDRKFLIPRARLSDVLSCLGPQYKIVASRGSEIATYRTTYFDTPDLRLFRDHVRGKKPRFKVRIRHYLERRCSFLEIKQKTNRGETRKSRLELPFGQDQLEEAGKAFVREHCPVDVKSLQASLSTHFLRITLVEPGLGERVTCDQGISFSRGGESHTLPSLVVAEVKQCEGRMSTPFLQSLRAGDARQSRFSKYAVGVAMAGGADLVHHLRASLRLIGKLAHG